MHQLEICSQFADSIRWILFRCARHVISKVYLTWRTPFNVPVTQWIEYRFSSPKVSVRFWPGAHFLHLLELSQY